MKDERNLDRFDRIFGHVFKGLETPADLLLAGIPEEWLRKLAEKHLTDEEKKLVQALGGLDKILDESASKSRRAAIRAAANGWAPPAPPPSALTVTTQQACASVRTRTATTAP